MVMNRVKIIITKMDGEVLAEDEIIEDDEAQSEVLLSQEIMEVITDNFMTRDMMEYMIEDLAK
jgi:hypothetical protein